MKNLFKKWNSISLVLRIICGLIIGIILGLVIPKVTVIALLGDLFVGALKAIAPLLVFFLVMSSLAHMGEGQKTNMGFIVMLYMLGNVMSALVSVVACKLFPVTLTLAEAAGEDMAPPSGVGEVLKNLLMNVVSNPVGSIVNANYIGILAWACIFGIALKAASNSTKKMLDDFSAAISTGVKWVISFAPFGIMGLIFNVISRFRCFYCLLVSRFIFSSRWDISSMCTGENVRLSITFSDSRCSSPSFHRSYRGQLEGIIGWQNNYMKNIGLISSTLRTPYS